MYEPEINDYVYWDHRVEGWVYFKGKEYITIEMSVQPKDSENYKACKLHRNDRLLVLCYKNQWSELKYIKSRESIYEDLEIVGKGIGREGIKE
jgi:hypothetical protein